MRLIHTSDLHLSENRPQTLKALQEVLDVSERLAVDMLTIGGDLFDSERDAEALRPQLRRKFTDNRFTILAIPGNHDREAYAENLDFGPDLKVVTHDPFEVLSYSDVSLIALPFRNMPSEQLYVELKSAAEGDKKCMLLLHCTLDIGFSMQDFGDETVWSYFPVSITTLSRLGYDYILAGHFHSQACFRSLGDKGLFAYPGSPISHTRKEMGKRQVVLIDTEKGDFKAVPLNSFYYDRLQVDVIPEKEDQVLEDVKQWVASRASDECALEIEVKGFIKGDEKKFRESLNSIGNNVEIRHEYRNVERILEHPLFRRFKEKLESIEGIEDKEKVEASVLDVMARLLADRKLRG